jgi:tetratricopeptide (TPR) repeat protein
MKKYKFFSIAFVAFVTFINAQDIGQAVKAVDAEQYDKAKSILKSIIKVNPTAGKANFILGNIYLSQTVLDSAKISFQKGLTGTDGQKLNYIGLGSLDLESGNLAEAEANFALALKDTRKKDFEELVAIGRAYTNASKPDYKKAIEYLNKAKVINPTSAVVLLALGDAFYGDKNQNEAYAAYRDAFIADPTLLRAKMQSGVLLKGAKSYDEAIKSFNEVIVLNENYGPVYRELAETYYKWGRNKPSKSVEFMQTAITNYEKYMTLTDYSLNSRMRHADFLVLVKDYKALEVEANKMIEMDKVNPRIFRYLGYSAFENGNVDLAIKSLESFIANPVNKVIAKDFLYLGNAKFKKGLSADGLVLDPVLFNSGIADVKKSIELEPLIIEDLNEIGKKLFSSKLYKEAAAVFELATNNSESKNYIEDNIYYGLSVYYSNNKKDVTPVVAELQKADAAFEKVTIVSPTYNDAYLYRARTNSLIGNDELTIKFYEEYVTRISAKGPEELAKPSTVKKVIESYNNIAASYANTDKVKAIEFLNKTIAIDPANVYATESLAKLKK